MRDLAAACIPDECTDMLSDGIERQCSKRTQRVSSARN